MFSSSIFKESATFGLVALAFSIIVVILAFIFIVPEKKRAKLNKFGRFLHDTFNFKYLIVEKILQALYIFLTVYVVIYGFLLLFYIQESYYGSNKWFGGYGILIMLFGPIVIRLIYELLMMAVLVVKNVISINNKLQNQNDDIVNDPFVTPDISEITNAFQSQLQNDDPEQSEEETAKNDAYCPNCGSAVTGGAYCSKCGAKL